MGERVGDGVATDEHELHGRRRGAPKRVEVRQLVAAVKVVEKTAVDEGLQEAGNVHVRRRPRQMVQDTFEPP